MQHCKMTYLSQGRHERELLAGQLVELPHVAFHVCPVSVRVVHQIHLVLGCAYVGVRKGEHGTKLLSRRIIMR